MGPSQEGSCFFPSLLSLPVPFSKCTVRIIGNLYKGHFAEEQGYLWFCSGCISKEGSESTVLGAFGYGEAWEAYGDWRGTGRMEKRA